MLLTVLQERLRKQQDDNDNERRRLEDLITRLETQIREQSRVHDEVYVFSGWEMSLL